MTVPVPCWLALALMVPLAAQAAPAPCQAIAAERFPDTTVISAADIPPGTRFVDPNQGPVANGVEICRVGATVSTTPGEHVGIELWLPRSGWNGRFEGLGSGGFGGSISYAELVPAVARGFAAATTDTGHVGGTKGAIGAVLSWARDPVQLRDWGHSAVHVMTDAAKRIVRAFYGRPPAQSYFAGCSTGGAEAMEEAEFYPGDYDGIEASSPGQDYSHLMESFLWGGLLPATDPASTLTPSALKILSSAVLGACGNKAERADGFLLDPRRCRFDPASLQCRPGRQACLSSAQVREADRLYAPVTDPTSGLLLYPGFVRGSESEWGLIQGALIPAYAQPLLANAVFGNPNWDWRRFDFHADALRLDASLSPVINADDPDLRRFIAHGGKLIMTQGWADALNAQTLPIEYADLVMNAGSADATERSFRLFLVPGMSHCGHGPGPTTIGGNAPPRSLDPDHDVMTSLERWTEAGTAPERFIASKYVSDDPAKGVSLEIPICRYPLHADYRGGDPSRAGSYVCTERAGELAADLADEARRRTADLRAGRTQNLPN